MMFTNFKHAIEARLRRIVRDEVAAQVSSINTSLEAERTAFENVFATVVPELNAAVDRLSELSHIGEATTLRNHIKDLEAKFTEVTNIIEKLHPSLVKK